MIETDVDVAALEAQAVRDIRRSLVMEMLEWESLQIQMKQVENEISRYVLALGETQVIGNVTARFFNGRRKFDYETPGSAAPAEIIERHSEVQTFVDWEAIALRLEPSEALLTEYTDSEKVVDWKAVCDDAEIDYVVLSQADPYVKIEMLK